MNVASATMQVNYWDARMKYLEYRELVKAKRATKEDDELRAAYRAITRGEKVIDINLAIAGGGLDAQGLPKLAIARADWEFVHAWWNEQRCVFSSRRSRGWKEVRYMAAHNVAVRFPEQPASSGITGKAQVPMIPPAHRPTGPLSSYRILFEAVWQRVPPVDPILLRHVGGPFYVVLAQWDLSPLEQAVLRAKL